MEVVRQYWLTSYGSIRHVSRRNLQSRTPSSHLFLVRRYPYGNRQQSDTVVLLHDAFQNLSYVPPFRLSFAHGRSSLWCVRYWDDFAPAPQYQGVALDTHIYEMFTQEVRPSVLYPLSLSLPFNNITLLPSCQKGS